MKKYIFILVATMLLTSCNGFLDEVSPSIKTSSNSFENAADFTMTVNNLYARVRGEFYIGQEYPFDYQYGTDLVYDGQPGNPFRFADYEVTLSPTQGGPLQHWSGFYYMVSTSNAILFYLDKASLTEEQKSLFAAQAKFFRAFAYRSLAYLYGGVPLELEMVTSPKRDYVRATKEEVLNQAVKDLEEASVVLPDINKVIDGEVSSVAALHLLSEVYLALGQFQKSIDVANKVISNPNMQLMKTRFGSSKEFAWADAFYDLFRPNNQNRASGNKEAIWVIQFEDIPIGGLLETTARKGYQAERHFAPLIRDFTIDGIQQILWPTSTFAGGRGVGFGVTTKYYSNEIWEKSDWNDLRNANHNFIRKFKCDNPASSYYGQEIDVESLPTGANVKRPANSLFAYPSKITTPFQHPAGLFLDKPKWLLTAEAGVTYTDQYMFRLAETYLIRAEAYLGLNKKGEAAADINVVRDRASAKPVLASEVDIDYILDERMRELGLEEKRRFTLSRLGQVYRRTTQVATNPYVSTMSEKHNLLPIPAREIEGNIGAKLEQNPGY